MRLQTRVEKLEGARRQPSQLVLIAPHGVLSAAQQAQHEAAERAGHDPLVIAIMPRLQAATTTGAPA